MERQTGQAVEKHLPGTSTLLIVGDHIEGKIVLKQRMTADDAQLIQANPGHRVQRNQHVSAHFFNRLQKKQTTKVLGGKKKKIPKAFLLLLLLVLKKPLKSVFHLCFHHCVLCL